MQFCRVRDSNTSNHHSHCPSSRVASTTKAATFSLLTKAVRSACYYYLVLCVLSSGVNANFNANAKAKATAFLISNRNPPKRVILGPRQQREQQQQQPNLYPQHQQTQEETLKMSTSSSSLQAKLKNCEDITNPTTSASTSSTNWKIVPLKNEDNEEEIMSLILKRDVWRSEEYKSALNLYDELMACTDSYIKPAIQDALNCLDHAYRLYGPKSVICSFNGGKDAVVVLHLLRAAHAHYHHQQQHQHTILRPRVLYFDHKDEFPELLSFLYQSVDQYDLDMIAFQQGVKFQDGLRLLVDNNYYHEDLSAMKKASTQPPYPMAFVLGTRTTDPNAGSQGQFAPSSHYMPPFMRVNPILDWSYGLVWHFLRLFQLPYCSLYDQGYTSLGTVKDTIQCPALAVPGATSANNIHETSQTLLIPKYWPAYMLRDWDQERAGRIKINKKEKDNKKKDKEKKERTTTTATTTVPPPPSGGANSKPIGMTTTPPMSSTAGSVSESTSALVPDYRVTDLKQMDEQQNNNNTVPSEVSAKTTIDENQSCVSYSPSLSSSLILDEKDDNEEQQRRSASRRIKTVGLVVIGDEILKGYTNDTNTISASKILRENNILLKRVVLVSDNINEIAYQIQQMSNDHTIDVIITSGGVGPTHDDVTIKSVAKALNHDMILHKEMAQLLKDKMNTNNNGNENKDTADDTSKYNGNQEKEERVDESSSTSKLKSSLTEAQIKMATLPCNSQLKYLSGNENDWPVLQCRNIFILPGVPEYFTAKITNVAKYISSSYSSSIAKSTNENDCINNNDNTNILLPSLERSVVYKVVLSVDEVSIVPVLNKAVKKHANYVSIGSYPFLSHPEFKTVLTLEGRYCYTVSDDNIGNNTGDNDDIDHDNSDIQYFTKEEMDNHVRLALDDLINMLPEGSILRVDNEDNSTTNDVNNTSSFF